MIYAIFGQDCPDSLEGRLANRPTHLARLEVLKRQGRLILAGPHPAIDGPDPGPNGFTGSLVIAEFDSLEEARSWAEEDPYRKAGVYQSVTVRPFVKVLP